MAVQSDSGGKDDVKTQFVTREGTYRLMTLSEYSRPNRVGYTSGSGSGHVRVSLVSLPPSPASAPGSDGHPADDRICFNHGKELYVYVYRGVKKVCRILGNFAICFSASYFLQMYGTLLCVLPSLHSIFPMVKDWKAVLKLTYAVLNWIIFSSSVLKLIILIFIISTTIRLL